MIMVIVLGATSAHAEQPVHAHGNSVELGSVERIVAIEVHSGDTDTQAEPAFHCGAAILGLECSHPVEPRFDALPHAPFGEHALPLRSIPLEPRPPRA